MSDELCAACRHRNRVDARFCRECGTSLMPNKTQSGEIYALPVARRSRRGFIIWLAAVILVFAFGFALAVALR